MSAEITISVKQPDGTVSVYLLPGIAAPAADPVPAIDREIQAKISQFGPLLAVARDINRQTAEPQGNALSPRPLLVSHPTLRSLRRVLVDLDGIADSTGFTW